MNAHDDWTRWGEQWRTQPAIDIERLRGEARRKLRRMRLFVGLELLATTTATLQLLWMLLQPDMPPRWKAWAALSLVFVAGLQATFLYLRRGTWQSSGDGADGMLALGLRRARAGIRLAKLNAWGLPLQIAMTLVVAAPDFRPHRWQHDPQFHAIVVAQVVVNGLLLAATLAFCAWYVRRQRRRIGRLEVLMRGERRAAPEPGGTESDME